MIPEWFGEWVVGPCLGFFATPGELPWFRRTRWGRVALTVVIALMAAYGACTTTAFLFVRYHRKMERVQFVDVVLPWRWHYYRVARGDGYLTAAFLSSRDGKFREAFMYSRAGLALSPAHRGGRLLFVQILLSTRDTVLARRTLLDGLAFHGSDPTYLKATFGFLLQHQEDDEVISLAERLLAHGGGETEAAWIIALAAATACHARGNYDRAEEFLGHVPRSSQSREGRLLTARLERDRGYRSLAIIHLQAIARDFPDDVETHRELVDQLQSVGRADEARRSSLEFQIAHPHLGASHVELASAYRDAGESERLNEEVATILRDFGSDQETITALAVGAATAGDVGTIKRIAAQAGNRQLPSECFDFLAVEAALVARDYAGAIGAIRALSKQTAPLPERHAALCDSFQTVAYHGLGDVATARVFLSRFLARQDIGAENLLAVANRLAEVGAGESARQALMRAIEIDPLNHAALARLVEIELALNCVEELAQHVQRFVRTRRPSPDILRVAQQKLGSDLFLFSKESPAALESVRAILAKNEIYRGQF